MSAMVNLEIPWINVMSKMDLVSTKSKDPAKGRNGLRTRRDIYRYVDIAMTCICYLVCKRYLDPDPLLIAQAPNEKSREPINKKFHSLNQAIVQLVSPS